MVVGFVGYFPVTMFIVNPLFSVLLVWALRLPDKGSVTDAGVQFWIAASIPAAISVVGVGLLARVTDEFAPTPWKMKWFWVLIPVFFPAMWALSLNGSHLTDRTASDVSGRFDISYFQAEFLQATAEPVLAVFFVTFFSVSVAGYAGARPNRRLRAAFIAAVYVLMAVAFVLVGRSAGDGYW